MTMSRFRLPCVIGHRGAARDAPENTLAAFRLAAAHGAPWVEIDVRRSAEGRCVVFHDETLKRVCGRADRVEDTPLAVLRGLDAGAWFDPAFAGQTIPTLDETLDALAELGLGVVVEIKPAPGAEARLVEGVLEALARRRPAAALLSSFQVEILSQAKRMAPDVPRALNARRVSGAMLDRAEELGCVSVHLRHDPPEAGRRGARQGPRLRAGGVVGGGWRARRRALAVGRRRHHHQGAGRRDGRLAGARPRSLRVIFGPGSSFRQPLSI